MFERVSDVVYRTEPVASEIRTAADRVVEPVILRDPRASLRCDREAVSDHDQYRLVQAFRGQFPRTRIQRIECHGEDAALLQFRNGRLEDYLLLVAEVEQFVRLMVTLEQEPSPRVRHLLRQGPFEVQDRIPAYLPRARLGPQIFQQFQGQIEIQSVAERPEDADGTADIDLDDRNPSSFLRHGMTYHVYSTSNPVLRTHRSERSHRMLTAHRSPPVSLPANLPVAASRSSEPSVRSYSVQETIIPMGI